MLNLLYCFILAIIAQATLTDIDLQSLQPNQATTITGSNSDQYFGYSVRGCGDINGDGIDDIIIGAPQKAAPAINPGYVYVIFGNKNGIPDINLASLTPTEGFTIQGAQIGDSTGWSVSNLGDVNGDGIDDLVFGAVLSSTGYVGAAYVVFGSRNPVANLVINSATLLSNGQGFSIFGGAAGDFLGISVTGADVNADGLNDLLVGAYGAANGALLGAGSVYVIFGRRQATTAITDIDLSSGSLSSSLGFTIQGPDSYYHFGISVSGVGDVNGDGISDVVIGAPRNVAGFTNRGAAYVIFGRKGITDINLANGLSSSEGFKIEGVAAGDFFGWPVGNIGDLNGDGLDDVIIGSPQAPPLNTGAAYVIFGRKKGISDIDLLTTDLSGEKIGFAIYGGNTQNRLGYAVKTAGDINGDGVDDLIVGSSAAGPGGIVSSGIAYVIYGSKLRMRDVYTAEFGDSQGFRIQGVELVLGYETSLSSVGDVNRDGIKDLAIGCTGNLDPVNGIYGSVYVISGATIENRGVLQAVVDIENIGTSAGRIVAMVMSLVHSSSVVSLWFIFLEQILQYPKYLLIEYPTRLQYLYNQPDFQLFSIPYISDIPNGLENKINEYSIPEKFDDYGNSSSFLVNFWGSLTTLVIILVFILLASLADYFTVSNKLLHPHSKKIKFTLKWNYIIAIFTGCFCDIALFTSLEMRTLHFENALDWISFFLCILINLAVIAVLVKVALVIRSFAHVKAKSESPSQLETFKEQMKSFKVIFEGFKDQTFKQQSYFLLFILRFYLFYAVIGYLFEHPLVQAIFVNIIGIATLLYLGFVRPFKEKLDFIVSLAQETILEIVHVCVFLFALGDRVDFGSSNFRVTLGDIVIGCNGAFMIVSLIYSFIMTLVLAKDVYLLISKKFCKQRGKSNKIWAISTKRSINIVNESQIVLTNPSRTEKESLNQTMNMTENAGPLEDGLEGLDDISQRVSSIKLRPVEMSNLVHQGQKGSKGNTEEVQAIFRRKI